MRADLLVALTIRSMPSIRSTSSTRPEKKKVSPGLSVSAKLSSTVPSRRAVLEADVIERSVDDDAGVHPVLLDEARVGDAPAAIVIAGQAVEAVIGLERIAAILDEREDGAEQLLAERRIGRGTNALRRACQPRRRAGAGHRHDMLGKHVERAGAEYLAIERAFLDRVDRGAGFEIFEAGCRGRGSLPTARRAGGCAADPLHQPRRSLWRPHLDGPDRHCPNRRRDRGWRCRTSPRSLPAAIADSTLRRASSDSDPWWMPIGRWFSLTDHRSWKINSARLRGVAEDEGGLVPLDLPHHILRRPAAGVGPTRGSSRRPAA